MLKKVLCKTGNLLKDTLKARFSGKIGRNTLFRNIEVFPAKNSGQGIFVVTLYFM